MKKFFNDHISIFVIFSIILSIFAIYQTIKVKDKQKANETSREKFIENYKKIKAEQKEAKATAEEEKPIEENEKENINE